jgi:glutathione peroxidase
MRACPGCVSALLVTGGIAVLWAGTGPLVAGADGPSTPATTPAATTPAEPAKTPETPKTTAPAAKEPSSVLDFTMKRIDGTPESLSTYNGQVILIVNTASKCGFTSQYEGLQKLYSDKKDAGLVVLGFPSNDFMGQEPGSNEDIAKFCTGKFNVTFPMFEKIAVVGSSADPLYQFLAAQPAPIGGAPKWNFTKFLVDRTGKVVGRYESRVRPDDAELLKKIDELLAQKP